jgi:sigma54-dependent transcription regulator
VVAVSGRAANTSRATHLLEVVMVDGNFTCEPMVTVVVGVVTLVLDVSTAVAELALM